MGWVWLVQLDGFSRASEMSGIAMACGGQCRCSYGRWQSVIIP